MNLKEAFRYQTFLNQLINEGTAVIQNRNNAFIVTKKHHTSKVIADECDKEEIIEPENSYTNDDVIDFLLDVIYEKYRITEEINKAKMETEIDVDAYIQSNKARRTIADGISYMLKFKHSESKESGIGYKFNAEGDQTPYNYEIDVTYETNFDKNKSTEIMTQLYTVSDVYSADVDKILVNTAVFYLPRFQINKKFENLIEDHIKNKNATE